MVRLYGIKGDSNHLGFTLSYKETMKIRIPLLVVSLEVSMTVGKCLRKELRNRQKVRFTDSFNVYCMWMKDFINL